MRRRTILILACTALLAVGTAAAVARLEARFAGGGSMMDGCADMMGGGGMMGGSRPNERWRAPGER